MLDKDFEDGQTEKGNKEMIVNEKLNIDYSYLKVINKILQLKYYYYYHPHHQHHHHRHYYHSYSLTQY